MTRSVEEFTSALAERPIIAILRGLTPETAVEVSDALVDAGITSMEVPLNSPKPFDSIQVLAERYRDRTDVFVGSGTTLTPQDAVAVAEAGGQYVVSPNTNPSVIQETKRLGMISIPGFYTPSEAFTAMDAGADFLKCFPVRGLGTGYIKDLKAVVDRPIVAVGGVDIDNMLEFLKVCVAVGIGSNLYSPKRSVSEISEAAVRYTVKLTQR